MQLFKALAIRLSITAAVLTVGLAVRNANAIPAPNCTYQTYTSAACQNSELCTTTTYINLPANPACPYEPPTQQCWFYPQCSQVGDPGNPEPGE